MWEWRKAKEDEELEVLLIFDCGYDRHMMVIDCCN